MNVRSPRLRSIYADISPSYEVVNHAMTMGLDMLWRRSAADTAVQGGGTRWLDACTGTGEMAAILNHRSNQSMTTIVASDFSMNMISQALAKKHNRRTRFVLAEVASSPFADNCFDLVTTAFATRNLNPDRDSLLKCFREFHRILKPGGRYVSLETSQPRSRPLRLLFHLYVRLAVRPLGYMIARSRPGYDYLSKTIIRFHSAEDLAGILEEAGFSAVDYRRMMFGAVAVHRAVK